MDFNNSRSFTSSNFPAAEVTHFSKGYLYLQAKWATFSYYWKKYLQLHVLNTDFFSHKVLVNELKLTQIAPFVLWNTAQRCDSS